MHTVINCRSSAQIYDDQMLRVHTELTKVLNAMCCGKCLYTGEIREGMKRLLSECEAYILGEGPYPHSPEIRYQHLLRC